MAGKLEALQRVEVKSRAEWRAWLEAHHRQSESIWLVTWRKQAGEAYLAWSDLVDEALCFGWIDSLPRKLDEHRTMHLLAPRKPGSGWSAINRAKVERLIAEGRMQPEGLAKVEAARRDGSWDALADIDPDRPPADLAEALAGTAEAAANFARFPRAARRAILEWIHLAKGAATRARRIAQTARLAAENLMVNHPKGRDRPKG